MISLCSQVDLDLRQVFTSVGTYKGSIVAVKRINKKYVDLTRSVRKELKLVRTVLTSHNIVSLIVLNKSKSFEQILTYIGR